MRTQKTTRSAQPKEGNSLENVAANFLNLLRPSGPWQLTAIYPERTKLETQTFTNLDDARKWIAERNSKAGLYYTPNRLKGSPNKKPEKVDVEEAEWTFIDLDYNDPGKAVEGSPPMTAEWMESERKRILALLTTQLPLGVKPPTARIFTGGGYQALWKFDKPFPINGEKERWEDYERYNKWLAEVFEADHCWNVERILRLPGTINIPNKKKAARGRKPMRAELEHFSSGTAYGLKDFKQAAATAAKTRATSGAIEQDVFSIDPSRVQGIEDITDLAKYGVPRDCQEIIAQGSDPDNPTRFPSGSEAQWYVTCELARRGVPAEVIYSIIADGTWLISAHVRRQKYPHTYALSQIAKAMDEAHDPDLAWLNEKHFVVGQDGGDCLVYEWLEIPRPKGNRDVEPEPDRVYLAHMTFEGFVRRYHKSKKITNAKGEEVSIPIGKWWL